MMKKSLFFAVLLLSPFLLGSPRAFGETTRQVLEENLNIVIAKNHGWGGGVFRVATDQTAEEVAAGTLAGPDSPLMTPQTSFEIASITKMVTAATILLLMEEGKLTLESTLSELLVAADYEGFPGDTTVKELLTHTSGFGHYWTDGPLDKEGKNAFLRAFLADPERFWSAGDILPYAAGIKKFRRGTFRYSDTNYVLLGLIIEKVSGSPLHRVYRKKIFGPLGMKETWLSFREAGRGSPPSHRFEGSEDLHGVKRQSADWAGGGLVSTASDLEKFLRGIASGALFSNKETLSIMLSGVPTGTPGLTYGMGVYLIQLDGGLGNLWGHDGHGNSFAYFWPEKNQTFTGTLNQTENDWWPLVESCLVEKGPPDEVQVKNFQGNAFLIAGYDSLYMDKGVNVLGNGTYGSGLFWTNVTLQWTPLQESTISLDIWNALGLGESTYKEFDVGVAWIQDLGNWQFLTGYQFSHGYGDGIYDSHELNFGASHTWSFGNFDITPGLEYTINLGPDGVDAGGSAHAGSGFLEFRMDASTPLIAERLSLDPWIAFGLNLDYNLRETPDGDLIPFTGANHLEVGLACPVVISDVLILLIYGAYSHAFTTLPSTFPDTFWGGFSLTAGF